MEEEPVVPEPLVRRSKRARVPPKTFDPQPSNTRDVAESDDDSVDDFEGPRPKPKRNRTIEPAPPTPVGKPFDQSLIEVVKGNGKVIPQVVKQWVEQYEKDPKPAMVELLTMLFEACGAKYRIQEISWMRLMLMM